MTTRFKVDLDHEHDEKVEGEREDFEVGVIVMLTWLRTSGGVTCCVNTHVQEATQRGQRWTMMLD